eukprot:1513276-Pleurochrysis_carterae.AAC.3
MTRSRTHKLSEGAEQIHSCKVDHVSHQGLHRLSKSLRESPKHGKQRSKELACEQRARSLMVQNGLVYEHNEENGIC